MSEFISPERTKAVIMGGVCLTALNAMAHYKGLYESMPLGMAETADNLVIGSCVVVTGYTLLNLLRARLDISHVKEWAESEEQRSDTEQAGFIVGMSLINFGINVVLMSMSNAQMS